VSHDEKVTTVDPLIRVQIPTTETTALDVPDSSAHDGLFSSNPLLAVQTCLLVIAVLTVAYFAADIVLPIVEAIEIFDN